MRCYLMRYLFLSLFLACGVTAPEEEPKEDAGIVVEHDAGQVEDAGIDAGAVACTPCPYEDSCVNCEPGVVQICIGDRLHGYCCRCP